MGRPPKRVPILVTLGDDRPPVVLLGVTVRVYGLATHDRVITQESAYALFGMVRDHNGCPLARMVRVLDRLGFARPKLATDTLYPLRFYTETGKEGACYALSTLRDICEALHLAATAGVLPPGMSGAAAVGRRLRAFDLEASLTRFANAAIGFDPDAAARALGQLTDDAGRRQNTFPDEFYVELYRLRGLPPYTGATRRPSYFGTLTNNIVYKRLAPGLLDELKDGIDRGETGKHKKRLFQRLSTTRGYPQLLDHLDNVIALMKRCKTYDEFMRKLDAKYPKQS